MDQQPPGTISCLFCGGIIPINAGKFKFQNHMKSIHDIFKNLDFLFSLHFLIETEKKGVIAAVQSRIAVTLNSEALDSEENTETDTTDNYDELLENSLKNNSVNDDKNIGEGTCGKDVRNLQAKIQFLKKEKSKIKENIKGQKILLSAKFPGSKEEKRDKHDFEDIKKFKKEDKNGSGTKTSMSFMCENCNKIFKDKYKLKRHNEKKIRCYNKEILECTKCNKNFKFYFQLRDHKCGYTKLKKILECEKCKKVFKDNNNYSKHINRKFSCIKTILKCEKCDRTFREKEVYETHIMKNYNCKMENWRVDDVGG